MPLARAPEHYLLAPSISLLGEVYACHVNQEVLASGNDLPAEKHDPVIKFMADAIARMREDVLDNTIA